MFSSPVSSLYGGVPLGPSCQQLWIFHGWGAMFTESVRISFPACYGGSGRYL